MPQTAFVCIGTAQNPFVTAWADSDLIGRLIFVGLVSLSLLSWSILLHKWWLANRVRKESLLFKRSFFEKKENPLTVSFARASNPEIPNAFQLVYEVLRGKTQELLEKNTKTTADKAQLAAADITLLESHACSTISTITKYLEKNLYLLSTVVTLSPFLGLLGTVYGILITFSTMGEGGAVSNAQVLGGLSLALTTTVLGLLNAIPALIGYNYLKNTISDFDHEMERFATEILSIFNMHYRTVEV